MKPLLLTAESCQGEWRTKEPRETVKEREALDQEEVGGRTPGPSFAMRRAVGGFLEKKPDSNIGMIRAGLRSSSGDNPNTAGMQAKPISSRHRYNRKISQSAPS